MPKFQMGVTIAPDQINDTARMGGASGANPMTQSDQGKFVKLAGGSRYDLCDAGDKIEGIAQTVQDPDKGTYDGYTLGGVQKEGRAIAYADGSEAAGTGSLAVGDYVVCGTVVAKGTALTDYPKVRKATNQPGSVPADLTAAADQVKNAIFAWRVIEILSGTGAVGDKVLIERVTD
jgi:hypothetical protein